LSAANGVINDDDYFRPREISSGLRNISGLEIIVNTTTIAMQEISSSSSSFLFVQIKIHDAQQRANNNNLNRTARWKNHTYCCP